VNQNHEISYHQKNKNQLAYIKGTRLWFSLFLISKRVTCYNVAVNYAHRRNGDMPGYQYLNDWVYRGNVKSYEEKLRALATNDLPAEKWEAPNKGSYYILRNYLAYTFEKLYNEKELADDAQKQEYIYEDEQQACFNTGLFDKDWQTVYFCCVKNNPGYQPWKFNGFFNSYTIRFTKIPPQAVMGLKRPNYFDDPSRLVFDAKLPITPQWKHILDEQTNFSRIPEQIRMNGREFCRNAVEGAIGIAKKRIEANYKTAVPQWYRGNIQLLIPLYLTSLNTPDLALVLSLSEDKSCYFGHTCLTIEMAYSNARLIAKPESFWLQL
jgi:hypothetical protein